MEHFTEDQKKEAKEFVEFYVDMVENYKNHIEYYLSDDVVLDWFGQTVMGEKKVTEFLKKNVAKVKHFLSHVNPVEKIGFRETHVVKLNKDIKKEFTFPKLPKSDEHPKTPPQPIQPSTSSVPYIERNPTFSDSCDGPLSPAKRFRPDVTDYLDNDSDILESETENVQVKNMAAEGTVQFHRPSLKKIQAETKWKRPCKLSIAYTSTNCKDFTIYLIIYEGNAKCRRNLLKEFEAGEPEN